MEEKKKKRTWVKWVIIAVIAIFVLSLFAGPRELSVTEGELNAKLEESLNQPGDNSLVDARIDLRSGVGVLMLEWEKGQTLMADIVVTPDGRRLIAENIEVTGAGLLDEVFKGLSNLVLNNVLTTISLSQQGLKEIRIEDDILIGLYGRAI